MTRWRPGPAWWSMAIFAVLIAGYGFATAIVGEPRYPPDLRESFLARPWGIHLHAFFGAVALLIGPFQLHRGMLRERARHRTLGKIYLVSSLIGGAAGLYLAFFSFGGIVTHLGFGALGAAVLVTGIVAYLAIRNGQVGKHREWMIRSYALIFAAATLRILIPTLMVLTKGDFLTSYRLVSWLCWVPNLVVAELIVARTRVSAAQWLPVRGIPSAPVS